MLDDRTIEGTRVLIRSVLSQLQNLPNGRAIDDLCLLDDAATILAVLAIDQGMPPHERVQRPPVRPSFGSIQRDDKRPALARLIAVLGIVERNFYPPADLDYVEEQSSHVPPDIHDHGTVGVLDTTAECITSA